MENHAPPQVLNQYLFVRCNNNVLTKAKMDIII